jgi:GNAT superfamily N-acetyltransferase
MNSFFDDACVDKLQLKPQILVLEVRHPDPERRDTEPAEWLIVQRYEHREHDPDGTLLRASISLRYQLIDASGAKAVHGSFNGDYDSVHNTVSLTSSNAWREGVVLIEPDRLRGYRIGTYLMNEIVQWAQRTTLNASVRPMRLSPFLAYGDNRERRNRLYERFGLVFDYTDASNVPVSPDRCRFGN